MCVQHCSSFRPSVQKFPENNISIYYFQFHVDIAEIATERITSGSMAPLSPFVGGLEVEPRVGTQL